VLGSSHAELPLVDAALRLGCHVATVSSGTPGLAATRSQQHYKIDYSNAVLIEKPFREDKFSSLVAGCNDFAAFTASQISESLHLKRFDSLWQTREIHLKDRFRILCSRLMIPTPQFLVTGADGKFLIDQFENLVFPVIVKPVDLTGGKGIRVCETPAQVSTAVQNALSGSRSKRIIVEELIQGQLRSASFFLNKGRPILLTHAKEYLKRDSYLVESALVTSERNSSRIHRLTKYVEEICRDLRLQDGLLHTQFISNEKNDYLVEACRRPPGDLYLLLPLQLQGHGMADLVVRHALGESVAFGVEQPEPTPTLRLCLMAPRNGYIRNWGLNPLSDVTVVESFELRYRETAIVDYRREKLGIVFLVGDESSLDAIADSPELLLHVDYLD